MGLNEHRIAFLGRKAQLEIYRLRWGLTLQVLVSTPNRLKVNRRLVRNEGALQLIGPEAGAFWETLQQAERPMPAVPGLTLSYNASLCALTFLATEAAGVVVVCDGRGMEQGRHGVPQLELQLIGPAAAEIWDKLQRRMSEPEAAVAGAGSASGVQ